MQTTIFAIIGLISMVVGLLLSLILPEIRLVAWGLIAFGIILVASSAIINFRRVRGAITSRRGKFSTGTTIMVSIFAGIIIFANAISVGAYHRFDFTALSQFTLTSQTKDVLAKLDMPVKVLCFFVPTDDEYGTGAYASYLLMEYKNYTNKLQIQVIDPDQHPEEARKYGISEYQSVVFETDLGERLISPSEIIYQAEHAFTNAILEVTGIEQKTVYFLSGHGEASPNDTLSGLADALQTNLLKVMTIDLQFTPAIPDNCATLIVAGPTKPMTDAERQIIADYLKSNREALFMTNPNSPDDIAKLLAPWGVDIQSGTIIDPTSYTTPNLDSPTIPRSRDYLGLTTVYFPGAAAIVPQTEAPTGMEVIPLVWTTKDSWVDKDFDPTIAPKYDPANESTAAYAIGALIEPTVETDDQGNTTKVNEGPYIVAFGDSDFVTNNHFFNGNNSDLFLTLVNALTSGTDVMSIDRKVLLTRRLIIGPEAETFITISSIALLPAIVLIIGVIIWWRRR
ncbi:MAG: GldG family protein [Dehalococcoidales bacterium]|nr:GldG family protein [Dehalococcoidales bacterium]